MTTKDCDGKSAAPEPLCPALKRRPAIRNPEPFSLPAFDEGGVFTFHGIEPQSLRDFWQEKIDDEYSGMYKKMKWDFWFFGESHQTRIWPENVESDDYDIFLHARSLKELGSTATSFRFRAPPEEIIRCLVFTIRDLKPRGPRGCFKIMKAARIDTRANMRDRFIVWEPMPHGKVKVYDRNSLSIKVCVVLDNFCLQQCGLLNSKSSRRDLYLWGTCQQTLAKKLVRVGLNRNVFTRKMEIQPRREYNFSDGDGGVGIIGTRADMDERSLCVVANATLSGGSVVWLEDLATGRRRWKRLCTETFTSVVLYPHHVLLLKQHAIANFASYAPAESNENPHARVMLADRRNGNPLFYGKNVRAVASGLRHWVVVKPRENSLTLLDLRHPPRSSSPSASMGFSVLTAQAAREKNADQVRASLVSKSGRYLLNVTKPSPYSGALTLKVFDLDELDEAECAGLTFERFQPKLSTCAILSDGSAILEAHKQELLLFIQRDKLPRMFAEFTQK